MNKIVTLFLILSTVPLAAAEQTVGSTRIQFPAPAGHCDVTGRTTTEVLFNKTMRELIAASGNTLFSIHADCVQLNRLNEGRPSAQLEDYAQYATPNMSVNNFYTSDFFSKVCASYNSLKKEDIETILKGIGPDIDRAVSGLKITEPRFLGVLFEEKDVCYTGMIARATTEAGQDGLHVGIFASVLVKGKLINYQSYSPFRGSQSVTESLNKHKANVAAFIAANRHDAPTESPREFPPRADCAEGVDCPRTASAEELDTLPARSRAEIKNSAIPSCLAKRPASQNLERQIKAWETYCECSSEHFSRRATLRDVEQFNRTGRADDVIQKKFEAAFQACRFNLVR